MGVIRIRTGGVEVDVESDAALEAMRRDGLLGPDTERWTGSAWRPLTAASGPAAPSEDPWAAWSDVDEGAAEALLQRVSSTAEEIDELPVAAVAPMPQAIVVVARPGSPAAPPERGTRPPPNLAAIPTVRPAPPPPAPSPAAAPPPTVARKPAASGLDGGEIIDFPRRAPRPSLLPREPEATPLVRPLRVFAFIGVGLVLLGGMWAFAELTRPVMEPVVSVGKAPERLTEDPLAEVERALRLAPLGDPRPVRAPADLTDAATVELQKLGVDTILVEAPITRWTGRHADDPAAAEIRVTFRPGADLNHDLGAILLVVGRYKLRYSLDISLVEATVQDGPEARATTLDAALAERFAQGRATLAVALGLK